MKNWAIEPAAAAFVKPFERFVVGTSMSLTFDVLLAVYLLALVCVVAFICVNTLLSVYIKSCGCTLPKSIAIALPYPIIN